MYLTKVGSSDKWIYRSCLTTTSIHRQIKEMHTQVLPRFRSICPVFLVGLMIAGCATRPGTMASRKGDEIMVAGKYVHTGTPVVLWTDPGGYDAYRVERRFAPLAESDWNTTHEKVRGMDSPARYSMRKGDLTNAEVERVRGGGWDLPTLQRVVDQFVIHFDVAGTSRTCFKVLHDSRDLSVHFMLDVDGTTLSNARLQRKSLARDHVEQPLGRYRNCQHGRLPAEGQQDLGGVV